MAEKNSWDSLSKKEKEEFGDKATYEAFLRALGTMKSESEEQRSMGVTPVPKPKLPKPKPKKKGINIKEGGLVLRVTKKGPLYKGKKSGNKKT